MGVKPTPNDMDIRMSIEALDWAFKLNRDDMTSTMKLVLLVLADFAGDEDEAYPRQTTISARSMLTREAVNKNLKKLEDIGIIESTGRTHPTGATRSSVYKLMIDSPRRKDARDTDKSVNEDHPHGVNDNHRGENDNHTRSEAGSHRGENGDHTFNHPKEEPPKEPPTKNRRTAPWPTDFRKQFWNLYPKKPGDSRKAAWLKLEKVEREDEVEFTDLMTGLRYYAERMNAEIKQDPTRVKYIAAASVWINQARWETERPPVKRTSVNEWAGVNGRRATAI
ncbi:helix-turn-helix domain-containing protein [Bradyrhizobium hipponense]|uniref:Helix-turn-helix domain-containing protein n=2 Tax=Bradyrhizobium hipponense TaxID=2605638 RepID=A0A5S4YP50_9BRAD|nr:helix-turn-helix domain-containing protein [Bradyrhizobium hipponense]